MKLVEFYGYCVGLRHLNIKQMVAGKTSQGYSGKGIYAVGQTLNSEQSK